MRFFHPSWAQRGRGRGKGRGMEEMEDRQTDTHTKRTLNSKRLQHGTDSVQCCDSSFTSPVLLEKLLPSFELSAQIKTSFSGEKGVHYSHRLRSTSNASCPLVLYAKKD